MRRGDVHWVRFPPAVGGMIRKTRPAVIVTKDAAIRRLNRVQVAPLTSNVSRRYPGEALITAGHRPSKALATQLTTLDKALVDERYASLSAADLAAVEHAMREQLDL